MNETLIYPGGAVKALGIIEIKGKRYGRIGGYSVNYGDAAKTDLAGDWFTPETYLGARSGDGVDCLFHHALPIKGFGHMRDYRFSPWKSEKRDLGLWSETVLDLADDYEARVYGLVETKKLGLSSGAISHMVRRADDAPYGEIKCWPIGEISLTPTPCEPRARAGALKALSISEMTQGELYAELMDAYAAAIESQEDANRARHAEMRAIEMQYIQREFMEAEARAMIAFLQACRA